MNWKITIIIYNFRYKKGKGTLEFLDEHPELKKGLSRSQFKRIGKDQKYGFGGQKKRSKRNTKESFEDIGGKVGSISNYVSVQIVHVYKLNIRYYWVFQKASRKAV